MIVKNERNVIHRSLGSIKHKIDYWVIFDTGSDDGTQEAIRNFMKDIPGELHERPWVHFEHNRNEALEVAKTKADYILFIDGDEEWVISQDFDKSQLDQDFYLVMIRDPGVDFYRIGLIKSTLPWRWEGVLHEQLECEIDANGATLQGIINYGLKRDGNRAKDPLRYQKDAEVLEKAFRENPNNSRYAFYLAQSYSTAKNYPAALRYYEIRSEMGGNSNDVFWSLFCIGCLKEQLKFPEEQIIEAFSKAYEFDKSRAEPICCMADYYWRNGKYVLGYILAKHALSLEPPVLVTYMLRDIYSYFSLFLYASCAHLIGNLDEARKAYEKLLLKRDMQEHHRLQVELGLKSLNQFIY